MNRSLQLLAPIMIAFVSACSGSKAPPETVEAQAFDDLREEVRAVIADPSREAATIELVSALEQLATDIREDQVARSERLRELYANYDAPRSAFESMAEQIEVERRSNREKVATLHKQFVESMTPEEWAQLDAARTEAISSAIRTLQSV